MDEFTRAEDHLDPPLGLVLQGRVGRQTTATWIFIGWTHNTAGRLMNFIRAFEGEFMYAYREPWHYHCSGLETALKTFPGLAGHRWTG